MAQWATDDKSDQLRAVWTFDAGVDTSMHPQFIKPTQTSDESGVVVSGKMSIKNRGPRTAVGPASSGTPQLLGVHQNTYLVRGRSGTVEYWNGSAWTTIFSGWNATARITMTNFEFNGSPASLFTNGVNAPKYWNGTTSGDLNTANAPKGKYIANDTVRVWIAKGDVLSFSARLKADDWTTAKNSGSVQVFTPQGGDITGLVRYGGSMLPFKKDYIGEIHGTNYLEFKLIDVSTQVGCYSHDSLLEVEGVLFWLGYKQIYAFAGGRPEPIGDPIMRFLEAMNWTNSDKCFAVTDGESYMIGVNDGTSTYPNIMLAYHVKLGQWRVNRVSQPNSFGVMLNNDWYTMDSTCTVYKEESGSSIPTMTVVSPAFMEANPELWKEYYELHIQAKIISGTLQVWCSPSVELDDFVLVDTLTPADSSTYNGDIIVPLDTFPICHWFRIKLVATNAEIYSVERYFNLLPADH